MEKISERRKLEDLSRFSLYFFAFFLVVVAYVRIRLLAVPLERDEGEFAYMGQLLLKGIPPYTYAYTMKLPGVSVAYAFFMFLFGKTPAGIHLGLLIINATCIWLLYLLAGRVLGDHDSAMFSCVSYAVLSLSSSVNGMFAHATHFVILFILAGFVLFFRFIDKQQVLLLFLSGLCFGLAVTMKQHAAILLIFAVLYFAWHFGTNHTFQKKNYLVGSFLFLLGMILPFAMIVLWMVRVGNFNRFWFWTVQYAREYASTPPFAQGWFNFAYSFEDVAKFQLPLWLLAGTGGGLLCVKKRDCTDRFFIFGFLLFSFLAICPGLLFRGHYFILLLPVVAILSGGSISSARLLLSSFEFARFTKLIPVLLFVAAITYSLYQEKDNFFRSTALEVNRATYGANPFPEALQIANYIKNNTDTDDRIAVLGSEPEIFFYADRLSATGHIYMYGLMENQPYAERMQTQLISEIEAARPKFIVLVNVYTSWLERKSSFQNVRYWGRRYLRDMYNTVGIIDIDPPKPTRYFWDEKAIGYTPVSNFYVKVFKRKSGV